jgi:ketosteroid isomerase-like protein
MTNFLVAESAIRQLHARYTDAVWRKDYASFGDCFAVDAEWRISGMVLRGRAEIVRTIEQLMSRYRCVLVTLRTPILDVGDGVASGRTYLSEQSIMNDGRPYGPIGTYYERFVDQGDRWRFTWRLFQTHYTGSPDMSGTLFDNPDFGPPPAMPPLDAPTYNHSRLTLNLDAQ